MTQPDPPSYDQQAYGPGIALVARLGASVSVSCNYQLPQHHARRAGDALRAVQRAAALRRVVAANSLNAAETESVSEQLGWSLGFAYLVGTDRAFFMRNIPEILKSR